MELEPFLGPTRRYHRQTTTFTSSNGLSLSENTNDIGGSRLFMPSSCVSSLFFLVARVHPIAQILNFK